MTGLEPWLKSYLLSALAWQAMLLLAVVFGLFWLRRPTSQKKPYTAVTLLLGSGFLAGCGLLVIAYLHLPFTSFPPRGFRFICLPTWLAVFCALGLVAPGRAKLSVLATAVTLACIGVLAFGYRLSQGKRFRGNVYTMAHRTYHPRVGYTPRPNADVRALVTRGSDTIYDVRYRHDSLGRRKNPIPPQANRYLLCFGGSCTYGEGVEDNQSWPAQVSAQDPNFATYNYAFGGWGPSQVIDLLESRDLGQELDYKQGSAVYLYMPAHVTRTVGTWQVVTSWGGSLSCYALKNEKLERLGTFSQRQGPFEFLISHSLGGLGLLRALKVDVPAQMRAEHYDLTAAVFERSQQLLSQQLPGCELSVAFFPHCGKEREALVPRLTSRGIRTFNLEDRLDAGDLEYIPGDGHPTAPTQTRVAQAILEALSEK